MANTVCMTRRPLFFQALLGLLVCFLLIPGFAIARNVITDLTVADYKDNVRIWVESQQPLKFHKIYLHNHPRLVLDFDNASLLDERIVTLWDNKSVTDIRYAYKPDNRLRMVFDLNKEIAEALLIQARKVADHYQLVIDLKQPRSEVESKLHRFTLAEVSEPKPVQFKNQYHPNTPKPNQSRQKFLTLSEPKPVVKEKPRQPPKVKARPAEPKKAKSKVKSASVQTTQRHKVVQPKESKAASSLVKKPATKVSKIKTALKTYFHPKPGRKIVVVIDPGHGGKDPGATGRHGLHEKDLVLRISKKLQNQINQQPGFTAVLTREQDTYLSLRGRMKQARKYHADMFVAIHADAYMDNEASGASVYALSLRGATSEAAHWLASKENESELVGGLNLTDKSGLLKSVLLNLSQTATLRASLKIGKHLIRTIEDVTSLHRNKVEQAAFVVLKSPDIPSILIETGFISNPKEEYKLANKNYQRRLAQAITLGIVNYFNEWPPRGTLLAQERHKLTAA